MGFFEDVPLVIMELLALSLVCIIMYMALFYTSSAFDTIPGYSNDVGHSLVAIFPIMDQAILLVFVFMMLATLILAWYIPSHPVMLIGYIVLVIILVLLAPEFTNLYKTIVENSIIYPFAVNFPIANALMSNLPLITIVFSALVAVVSYGKPRSDQIGVMQGLG